MNVISIAMCVASPHRLRVLSGDDYCESSPELDELIWFAESV